MHGICMESEAIHRFAKPMQETITHSANPIKFMWLHIKPFPKYYYLLSVKVPMSSSTPPPLPPKQPGGRREEIIDDYEEEDDEDMEVVPVKVLNPNTMYNASA